MRRIVAMIVIMAVLVVFAAALVPQFAPPGDFGFDKFVHVATFAALAGMVSLVLPRPPALRLGLAALIVLGAAIEIAQCWVPGRTGSVADWAGDVVGVALGAAIATRRLRRLAAAEP